ncbi:MAG TPA: hypothetical protein VHZ95_04275, partial [Polyangiales bacterium]|nr:hypothetical protein [Polyangiales bacterium]
MSTNHRRVRVAALFIIAMTVACQAEKTTGKPGASAGAGGPMVDMQGQRASFASLPLSRVISRDALGRGRFLLGPALKSALLPSAMSAELVARMHLTRNAHLLGVNSAAMQDAPLQATHALAGGAQLLQFGQRAGGLEVFGARANVMLD